MSGSVSSRVETVPEALAFVSEGIVPIASRELFWRAKYLRQSGALAHLPFLFWLITDLRPQRVVTLNVGEGVAHFAACQALERAGYEAQCTGVGVWDGNGVPEALARYNEEQYAEFSTLSDASIASAARRVPKRSVDFLIVELPLSKEDLEAVFDRWSTRLSDQGVIAFFGLDSLSDEAFDLFEEMSELFKTLRLDHGGGVAMCVSGEATGERSKRLLGLDTQSTAFLTVERIFSRLGAMHTHEWIAKDKSAWARDLSKQLKQTTEALSALQSEHAVLTEQLGGLERETTRSAEDQAALESARERLDEVIRERDDIDARLRVLQRGVDEREQTLLQEGDLARKELEAQIAELTQALAARDGQDDALQGRIDDLTRQRDEAEARRMDDSAEMAQLRAALEVAQARSETEAQEAEARHLAEIANLTETLKSQFDTRTAHSSEVDGLRETLRTVLKQNGEDIALLTATLGATEERFIKASETLKGVEDQLEEVKERSQAQIADLETQLQTQLDTVAQLREEVAHASDERAISEQRLETAEAARIRAETERDELKKRIVALAAERDAAKASNTALAAQAKTVEADLAKFRAEAEASQARFAAEQDKTKALEADVASARAEVAQVKAEALSVASELKEHQSKAETQAAAQETALNEAGTALKGVKAINAQQTLAIEELTREVEALRKERDQTAASLQSQKAATDKARQTARSFEEKAEMYRLKVRRREKELDDVKARLRMVQEDRQSLELTRQELMNSTSWRVTEPLRQVTSAMRRPSK